MPTPQIGGPSGESVAEALSGCPVLGEFDRDTLETLAGYMTVASFAPGDVVVSEGAHSRDMFFVFAGEARITHGAVEVAVARPGQHFGELGLVGSTARAATVTASRALEVARFSAERFEEMVDSRPELALRFVRALFTDLRELLADMTESVGVLLRERSLPRRTHLQVIVNGEARKVLTGTPVQELLPEAVEGRPVVAGLKDRRAVSLISRVSSDCTLEPLTAAHPEGQRIYRRSLALLLLEAAQRIDPDLTVQIEHSVGYGQRVRLANNGHDLERLATELQAMMEGIAHLDQPLREEWWTVDEARIHFRANGWDCAAELLRTSYDSAVRLATYGEVYSVRIAPLLPRTARMEGFSVLADSEGLLLVYGRGAARQWGSSLWPGDEFAISEAFAGSRHAGSMTAAHELWLGTLGITSVGEFNRACIGGDVSQLIRVSEGFQEKRISTIADEIHARIPDVKMVCVAGPSSSGKTTFIRRLKTQLQVDGIHPVGLSLDDYYVDREQTPLDDEGEFDFEAFEALNVTHLQDHLGRLLAGERVATSRYDFVKGRNYPAGGPEIVLRDNDLLMMEGIHGLNPRLLWSIPDDRIYRLFICPLAQLPFDRANRVHASDVRLIRRIVRDRHHRGHSAAATIQRWPSVRRGERKHIFPYQHHADSVFDSSLIYELSVLKVFAERYLLEVPHEHESYTTAVRLLQFLGHFVSIYPDHVPPTSLLREFIGGSGFEY